MNRTLGPKYLHFNNNYTNTSMYLSEIKLCLAVPDKVYNNEQLKIIPSGQLSYTCCVMVATVVDGANRNS